MPTTSRRPATCTTGRASRPPSARRSSRCRSSGRRSTTCPTRSGRTARNGIALFADGERFQIGNLDVEVMFTPGHTLASIAYRVGDAAFIHDTLFMPDSGTARADFPGGSAQRCGTASSASWRCRTTRGSSPATTTGPAVARRPGRARSPSSGLRTPHLMKAADRGRLRRVARDARPRVADAEAHPACRCRSTSAAGACRAARRTAALSEDPAGRPDGAALGRMRRTVHDQREGPGGARPTGRSRPCRPRRPSSPSRHSRTRCLSTCARARSCTRPAGSPAPSMCPAACWSSRPTLRARTHKAELGGGKKSRPVTAGRATARPWPPSR